MGIRTAETIRGRAGNAQANPQANANANANTSAQGDTRGSGRGSVRSRRSATFAVWYLRAVTFVNLLSAVWFSLGQDLRRHSTADFYTPYLLTAGFASAAFSLLLTATMGRRKRAAWILNLVLSGLLLAAFAMAAVASFTPCSGGSYEFCYPEFRVHPQNWVAFGLTALFVGALLLGRREFYAKETAPTRCWPAWSPPSACW